MIKEDLMVHDDEALTKQDVARLFRVSPGSVADRRWRRRVGLPAIKIGKSLRFRRADVLTLLRGDGREGAGARDQGGGGL